MSAQPITANVDRIDEAQAAADLSKLLTKVITEQRPLFLSRNGEDCAALIPKELFEELREALAMREVERLSKLIDWEKLLKTHRPPQEWFDRDEPKPF